MAAEQRCGVHLPRRARGVPWAVETLAGLAPGEPSGPRGGLLVAVCSACSWAWLGESMRGLTAKVTSGLLPLPEVSLQALEDEVTVESVLHGKIAAGRRGLACLACGQHLEVVHSLTGERLSAYRFSGVNQQPPIILAMKEFSWQKRVGLLIGLEEAEGSVLCLYDLGVSRVVKAVVLPGRVTAIEPIVSHGGASASTQHLHPSLRWLFGVAAVVTDIGQILLIDLCLDDMSCSQNELEASDLEVVSGIPAEVPHIRETVMREGRHLCFQLVSPSGTPVSALRYISRTNQLAVGFSDGYLALWNMKSMKREYYTQLEGGRVPVYAVTFQEPENDPRNCCYLWAVQSTQDSEGDVLSLHLLQLAFGDRKCLASGQVLYEGLEYCEERYTLDLTGGMFPLRGQTSNTKLLGCQSIEKYRYHGDREEALSPDTSVSVFTWQVNIYGQGKPSMYLGLFDINRWYHAQMPDSLRSGEYLHNCSYFALWSLESVVNKTYPHYILDVLVNERSLSRGIPPSYPPPEQFFNANIYNFDATCLLNSGIVHVTCNGFQKETLRFLKKSGASLSEFIPDGYNRCLMAGLLSPRLNDTHPSSLSQEEQLEAILSAAIHTSCLGLLTGCIKKWTKEEQPNSAANLRFVLEWTWNKVVFTKEEFDRLCTPLFDGSCRFIDPQTIQSLQQCHLLLSNLNSVLNCFTTEAQEITERGLMDLYKKCLVTRLICQYTQVVLWFCHSGLLPEGLDDAVQLSRLYYNYPVIQNYYTSRRQKCERLARGKWNPDCLMIDEMVSQLGDGVERLWKRDEGGTGKYPPSSLHALLDIYLLDDVTETSKHAVTIYLLLDIMYSFPNKTDSCIESFPTAFAIPWGQVKLIQGFWLIDHNDYGSGLDLLFHPATVKPVSWQHSKIIQAFMSQGEHRQALRYIQTMKPTVSSGDDVTLHLTVLLSNKYMVEAWTFLRQHSTSVNVEALLTHTYKVCQETGLMEDLLKLPFTDLEQDCLVRFLQSSTNVRNHEFLLVHYLQRANYVSALRLNQTLKTNFSNDRDPRLRERSEVRNAIVEQYGKVLPKIQRRLAIEQAKPYHLSTSPVLREVSRPQPLSTITKQAATGTVLTRSAFISNVLSKIGEIWACTGPKGGSSAYKSPRREPSPLPHPQVPEAFVGTPILKASQKNSRPLDLVVHPVHQPCQRLGFIQQTPKRSPLYLASSSLFKGSPHSPSSTLELRVLETPFVVKRAKTLAMSVTSSGFAEFTPQSILRSGLRTPPLPSPSLSPGRSVTPPLRLKETRISFMEEDMASKQTAGGADDSKTRLSVTTPLQKCGVPAKSEWLKSKAKTTDFSLNSPEKDHQEAEVRSQDTPSQILEKLDMSRESSGASTKSDQTTLEYQDAPSPGDLEGIFVASKPVSSSVELIINVAEPTKDSDKDVLESEGASPDLEKQAGTVDDAETKNLLVAEEVLSDLNHLHRIPGVEASLCVPPAHERKILTLKSQVPVLDEGLISVETCTSAFRAAVAHGPDDSGDSGLAVSASPVISEHKPDQEGILNLQEDHKVGPDVLKPSVDFPEAQPPVPDDSPDPQEIHVTEHEELRVQDSGHEARSLSFSELYPAGTLKLQYNFDTIEQQFCDLPDNKDSAECDVAEVEGELFGAQSNFTLILEGEEGELEAGDSAASNVLAPAANAAAEEKPVCSEENSGPGCVAELPPVRTSDRESQKVETLPYVPEPIKVAIAENLLDVIKDTRSKEITSDSVEQQSIHENIPLISQRVVSKVVKSTLKTVQETSTVTINMSQLDDTISSRTRRRGRVQNLGVRSAGQEDSTAVTAPDTPGLSDIRRTRKRKEISEASDGACSEAPSVKVVSQNQQIPQNFVTPRRGRKRREDQDTLESDPPLEQGLAVTPDSKLRRVKSSQLLETAAEKMKLSSVTKKTPKGIKKSVEYQETVEMVDLDLKVSKVARRISGSTRKLRSATLEASKKTPHKPDRETNLSSVTKKKTSKGIKKSIDYLEGVEMVDLDLKVSKVDRPSGSTRKLRSANLEASVSKELKPDEKSMDQPPPVEPDRGSTKRESSMLDVPEESRFDASQPCLQAEFGRPRKRGRPRKLNPPEDAGSKAVKEVRSPKRRSGALSSQRRSTRNTPAKRKTDVAKAALEKSALVPTADFAVGSRKKLTEKVEDPSHTGTFHGIDEETATMERDNPEEKALAAAAPPKSSRRTRTRSSKAVSFPDLSEPKNEFVFSTPVSKVPRKEKGKKIETPAQLQELVSDLSSRFVFSPPALRTRRKTTSNTSRAGDELEDDAPSVESVGRPKVKATRTAKTRQASKIKEEDNWSPPPVKIRLISPLPSPIDEVQSKPKRATAAPGRAPGRGRKKLSSFPKQVLRRKML